jgi:hypothetical protein
MATQIRLYEPPVGGFSTNYTGIEAQAQAADVTWVLPAAQGAASTFLSNDGAGNLSWQTFTGIESFVLLNMGIR